MRVLAALSHGAHDHGFINQGALVIQLGPHSPQHSLLRRAAAPSCTGCGCRAHPASCFDSNKSCLVKRLQHKYVMSRSRTPPSSSLASDHMWPTSSANAQCLLHHRTPCIPHLRRPRPHQQACCHPEPANQSQNLEPRMIGLRVRNEAARADAHVHESCLA